MASSPRTPFTVPLSPRKRSRVRASFAAVEHATHNRKSIRLRGWDYTTPGWYFVTINTHDNAALFGAVVNGHMVLSAAGRVAEEEWQKSATIRQSIALDEFVAMPNHVHGVVRILQQGRPAGRPSGAPLLASGSLGAFVAGYKGAVGRRINIMRGTPGAAVWHRDYWDVIVRDEQALVNIRRYIRLNPQNYQVVMQPGAPRFLGDHALLEMTKVGFLASRGKTSLPGKIPLGQGEALLSGFLSPMERALFQAGLTRGKPMIWVRPWGLADDLAPQVRAAIAAGRLLLISPFDDRIEAPSVRRAAWCNQYVVAHCNRLLIGHLNPGGMLACILSEAAPGVEVVHL